MSHTLLFDAQMAFNTWVLDGQESGVRPGKRGPARSHIGNDDTALSTGSKKKWAIILIPISCPDNMRSHTVAPIGSNLAEWILPPFSHSVLDE